VKGLDDGILVFIFTHNCEVTKTLKLEKLIWVVEVVTMVVTFGEFALNDGEGRKGFLFRVSFL
jgi:hypothetical protein